MLVRDTIIAGSAANRRWASREDSDKWRLKRGRREKEATQRGAPCHSSLFLNTLRTTSHDDQNSGHLRHVWVTPSEFRRRTHRRWRKEEKRRGKTVRNEDRPVGMDTRAGKQRNKDASERRERNRTRKSEWEESEASAAREQPRIRDESLNRKGFESIAGTVIANPFLDHCLRFSAIVMHQARAVPNFLMTPIYTLNSVWNLRSQRSTCQMYPRSLPCQFLSVKSSDWDFPLC